MGKNDLEKIDENAVDTRAESQKSDKNTKKRKIKIIDIIIFSLLSIPTIILNLIIIIYLNTIKIIKNKLFTLFKQLENNDKWNLIIKKSTNISIIISFIIVYIIMVLFKEKFFPQIIDIFTFLSTVILLPLIYDSIKSNK